MNGPTDRSFGFVPNGASATIPMSETFTPETVAPFVSTAFTWSVQPAGRSKSCGIDTLSFCDTTLEAYAFPYTMSALISAHTRTHLKVSAVVVDTP